MKTCLSSCHPSPCSICNTVNKSVNINTSVNPSSTNSFEPGTKLIFPQLNAPIGWTKDLTLDNKALRISSSSGGSTGGTITFDALFTTEIKPTGVIGYTVLTIEQMPRHSHTITMGGMLAEILSPSQISNQGEEVYETNETGNNEGHTHTLTMNNLNLNVQYVNATICIKD